MLSRLLMTALVSGALAGVFVFASHMAKTTPLILLAEVYENAELAESHAHEPPKAAHNHAVESDAWAPDDGLERSAYTLLADLLTSIGFAFTLVGAIALRGRSVDWRSGMVWGLCGFASFYVGPSLGLAPEVPGMAAADLVARQFWWLVTAVATAGGLALIFFAGPYGLKAAGLALMAAPHVVGAPSHTIEDGGIPAELAAQFAVTTLLVTGLFWLLLGSLTGYFYRRFGET